MSDLSEHIAVYDVLLTDKHGFDTNVGLIIYNESGMTLELFALNELFQLRYDHTGYDAVENYKVYKKSKLLNEDVCIGLFGWEHFENSGFLLMHCYTKLFDVSKR